MDTHRNDIRSLTGLRGIAALWVALYHVTWADTFAWPAGSLINHGYLAVDIFFILSGFVMAMSYRNMFERAVLGRNYVVFLIRRFARVYPLYAVVTLFIVAINLLHLSKSWEPGIVSFIVNILMIQGWGLGDSIDHPSWSVSTELAAYLLFPLFALATLRGPRVLAASGLVFVAGIVTLSLIDYGDPGQHGPMDIYFAFTPYPLMRCLCEFGIGLVTFRLAGIAVVRRLAARSFLALLLAAAMLVLLAIPKADIFIVALTPLLILSLAIAPHTPVSRFMAWGPVFLLGEISYAVYLLHFEFLRIRMLGKPMLMKHGLPSLPADIISSALFFITLMIASYIAFRYFEVPARKAIRRLEDVFKPRAAEEVVESEALGRQELGDGVTSGG